MCAEKNLLVKKKKVYKWAKHEITTTVLIRKDGPWSENTVTIRSRKILGAAVNKESQGHSLTEH